MQAWRQMLLLVRQVACLQRSPLHSNMQFLQTKPMP